MAPNKKKTESKKKRGSSGWGGFRPGAGRKPKQPRKPDDPPPHRARPKMPAKKPIRVVLHAAASLARVQAKVNEVLDAYREADASLRVTRSTTKGDRIELVVVAKDARAFSLGMRSLTIRLGRALNVLLDRSGPLFPKRYAAMPIV